MKNAVTGGLAAVCLAAVAGSAGAQIHNHPVAATPVYASSAPQARTVAPTMAPAPRHANWRSNRFHDCMKRYHDRKGCYYLAWHRHGGHDGHGQGK